MRYTGRDSMADLPLWGKSYGCHQFLNWWPPHATGMGHLNGFESLPLYKKFTRLE